MTYKNLGLSFMFHGLHLYRNTPGFYFESYFGHKVDDKAYGILDRPLKDRTTNICFVFRLFGRLWGARLLTWKLKDK